MKSFFFLLPLLGILALADDDCQCPEVRCPSGDAVALCNCLNNRETLCKKKCPDYVPRYLPCPARPTFIPSTVIATTTPTSKHSVSAPTATCACAPEACPMIWPYACTCMNGVKQRCYEKCGGPVPSYQSCPSLTPLSTLLPIPSGPPAPTTVILTASAVSTNPVCGGGRGNYKSCVAGWTCIKNPSKPGCGPECDGLGICVEDKICGGFAAFKCSDEKVCVDDPRDDCDPKNGGTDCGGLCMFQNE